MKQSTQRILYLHNHFHKPVPGSTTWYVVFLCSRSVAGSHSEALIEPACRLLAADTWRKASYPVSTVALTHASMAKTTPNAAMAPHA
jgi:hypothetical protein